MNYFSVLYGPNVRKSGKVECDFPIGKVNNSILILEVFDDSIKLTIKYENKEFRDYDT